MNANETKTPEWEIDLLGGTDEQHEAARDIIREASRNWGRRNQE